MNFKSVFKFRYFVVLLVFLVGYLNSFSQSAGDIHQYVCRGGERLFNLSGTNPGYVRWRVENKTQNTFVYHTTNEASYTFTMPDSGDDVFEVYAETRNSLSSPWQKANGSVVMYPYDMPNAFINPSGEHEFSGSQTLNGQLDGSVPISITPIKPLELKYEWRRDGELEEEGSGHFNTYYASQNGYYTFKVYDVNERVSGCSSTSAATLLVNNSTENFPVCEGSFIKGDMLLDLFNLDQEEKTGGEWTVTDGLTFSDTKNSNSVISGFVQGNNYSIKWQKDPRRSYSFNLNAGVGQLIGLRNESGSTSAVILCDDDHAFSVVPAGDSHTFAYRKSSGKSIVLVENTSASTYTFIPPQAGEVYEIYAIVKRADCFYETNTIEISKDEDIEIRVEGDHSICEGNHNFRFKVVPYDSYYSYSWEKDGMEIATGEYVDVSTNGEGNYTVTITGCGDVEYTSEPVEVADYSLSAAINSSSGLTLCNSSSSVLLNGSSSSYKNLNYRWLYNNDEILGEGSGLSPWNAEKPGMYEFMVIEEGNPLCYAVSNQVNIEQVDISLRGFYANGATSFCGHTMASVTLEAALKGSSDKITVVITNLANNTSQIVVLNSEEAATIDLGLISASTTFKITSVSAAGCSLPPSEINLIPEISYVRDANPLVFNITGDNECGFGTIGLLSSEVGVDYFLYKDGEYAEKKVLGAGNQFSFAESVPHGIYTVKAEKSGCENLIDMSGEITIYEEPLTNQDIIFTGGGCSGNSHTFRIENAESDVKYSLYRDGVKHLSLGNSNIIEFAGITEPGIYTVYATRGSCNKKFDGDFKISKSPDQQVIVDARGCEGTPLSIRLENSEVDFHYYVNDEPDGTGNRIRISPGDGGPISFDGISDAGIYSIEAVNPGTGCELIFDENIVVHPKPDLTYTLSTVSDPVCGNSNHTFTLSNSQSGIKYRLYRDNYDLKVDEKESSTGGPISFYPQPVVGKYFVTADNNGCEYKMEDEGLTINPVPTKLELIGANVCDGETVVISIANPQPGVRYELLQDGSEYQASSYSGPSGEITWSGPFQTGIYTVRGNIEGCITNMDGDVRVNALPSNVSINGLASDYCEGTGNVSFSGYPITGGKEWIVKEFEPIPGWFYDGGNHTASIDVDGALGASGPGSYTIIYKYTDPDNGCINTASQVVNFHPDINDDLNFKYRFSGSSPWESFDSATPLILCQDMDPIDLQAVFQDGNLIDDGYFYSLSSGLVNTGNGRATFNPDIAGVGLHNIQYTYTDANGCSGSVNYQIQVGVELEFINLDALYCIDDPEFTISAQALDPSSPPGGKLSLFKEDNPDFVISDDQTSVPNPVSPSLDINPSSIGPGTYTFEYIYETGSDDNYCANIITKKVVIPENLAADFVTESGATQFCENQISVKLIPVQPGGKFTGQGVSANVFSPSVAGSGAHEITYTINTAGCFESYTTTLTVVELPEIFISGLDQEYCENEEAFTIESNLDDGDLGIITFSSTYNGLGISPITDNGDGTAIFDPSKVGVGIYDVRMKYVDPVSGCVAEVTQRVELFAVTYVNFDDNQPGDSFEYCQNIGEVLFSANLGSGATGSGVFALSGGSASALDNHGNNTATLDPALLVPGNYKISFLYQNANGCTSFREKELVVYSSPTVYEVQGGGAYCINGSGVDVSLSGSQTIVNYELLLEGLPFNPPITMDGSGGSIEFSGLTTEGTYTINAINKTSGCESLMNGAVTVKINELSLLVQNIQNVLCKGASDGEIQLVASGGSAPYTYTLYDFSGSNIIDANNTGNFNNLGEGTYYVEVEDAIDCKISALKKVKITEPSTLISVVASSSPVGCMPCTVGFDCEGSATLSVSGGSPYSDLISFPTAYDIEWRDSGNIIIGNGLSITNKPAGEYHYLVKDANGCEADGSIEIESLDPIIVTVDGYDDVSCFGDNTGQFHVSATDGDANAEYEFSKDGVSWHAANSGADAMIFANLYAGTYTAYVRDKSYPRCIATSDPIVIHQPAELTLALHSKDNVTCYGGNNGEISVMAQGGEGSYEYSIDNGASWQTSNEFENLSAGTYNIFVRDDNACVSQLSIVSISQPEKLQVFVEDKENSSCFDTDDGRIKAKATGGSGNYSYSLDGSAWQTNDLFENLEADIYQLRVRDVNDIACISSIINVDIDEPAELELIEDLNSHKDVDCHGGNNGSFRVTASGGSGSYEFSLDNSTWLSNNTAYYVFSNLEAGDYSVWVREQGNISCSSEIDNPISITEPDKVLSITGAVLNNIECYGEHSGSITLTVEGGNDASPYSYKWWRQLSSGEWSLLGAANNGITASPDNLQAGTYRVNVSDIKGCSVEETYVLTQPVSELEVNLISVQHVTANGGNNGTLSIGISGGTGGYDIVWSGIDANNNSIGGLPANQTDLSNLIAGVYTATVSDANNCAKSLEIEILEPGHPLQIHVEDLVHPLCFNDNTGVLELRATGGTYPYVLTLTSSSGIEISPSLVGNIYNFSGLQAGYYHALLVDSNNESETISNIEIIEPHGLKLHINHPVKDASCFGTEDGQVVFNASGGTPEYKFTLFPDKGPSKILTALDDANQDFDNLKADRYLLMVEDNNACLSSVEEFFVQQPDEIKITGVSQDITCFGANDGSIDVEITGGRGNVPYYYNWYEINQPTISVGGASSVSSLPAGAYQLEIIEMEATSCAALSDVFVIAEPSEIIVAVDVFDVNTCKGDNSGRLVLNITGGVPPYVVDYGSGSVVGQGPSIYIENLIAGNYNLKIIDNNGSGCEINVSDNIISEPSESVTLLSLNYNIDCDENQINSGSVAFEVAGGIIANGYDVVLKNLTEPAKPPFGMTILPGEIQPAIIDNLQEGQYELSIQNRNIAISNACPAIVENFELNHIKITGDISDAVCAGANNGAVNIDISGGVGPFTYNWFKDGEAFSDEQNLSGLSAGTYILDLYDEGRNCTVSESFVVQDGKTLVVEASVTPVSCYGGTNGAIIINNVKDATPPLQYYWDGVLGNESLTDLSAGNYELRVVDGDGCEYVRSFNVSQPTAIDFDLSTRLIDCEPYNRVIEIENLNGGNTPYSIIWSGPGSFSVAGDKMSVSEITKAGTYKVMVRDHNACETEQFISVPGKMDLSAKVSHINCFGGDGGMIDLIVSGGSGNYLYVWSEVGNGFVASSQDLDGLSAGVYKVIVSDLNQICENDAATYIEELQLTVSEPDPIQISYIIQHPECSGDNGGIIEITDITGGTGAYTLTWAPASAQGIIQGLLLQNNLEGGEYTLTIRDENNCPFIHNFIINEPDPLSFDLDISDSDCDGNNRVEITNPEGGSGIYRFIWAGPGIDAGFEGMLQENLPGGDYNIIMMDEGVAGSCYITKSFSLIKPLQVSWQITGESCPGRQDGAIELAVVGGLAPYSYEWESIDGGPVESTNRDQAGLRAGTYQVVVRDARDCELQYDIEIDQLNKIELGAALSHVKCKGELTGAINLTVSGGSGNYSYSWSNGSDTEDLTGLGAGIYTVEVTDLTLGCLTSATYTINEPENVLSVNADITHVRCKGMASGAIDIEVNGGTAPYTYQWSSTSNENVIIGSQNQYDLRAGIYELRITDDASCVGHFGPYEVEEPVLELEIGLVDVAHVSVVGGDNGFIETVVSGGVHQYNYYWELWNELSDDWESLPGSNYKKEQLVAGLYRITVIDGNDCQASLIQRITEPDALLTIDLQIDHSGPCHGAANGSADIQVSGGTPMMREGLVGYLIDIKGPEMDNLHYSTAFTLNNLLAGDYVISVTDSLGVVEETSFTINEPDLMLIDAEIVNHVTCYGGADASVKVAVSEGSPNTVPGGYYYQIQLIGSGINRVVTTNDEYIFEDLPEGAYTIRVWDDYNGDGLFDINYDCMHIEYLTINQPEAYVVLSVVTGDEVLCEGMLPQLQLIISNWDVAAYPLKVMLNDGTEVTVDHSPYLFVPHVIPEKGQREYEITSVININTDCSAGTFEGKALVVVNPLPTASIFGDNRICLGDPAQLRIELTGTAPWNITFTDGTEYFHVENITESLYVTEVWPFISSSYTITELSDLNCSNIGTGTVTIDVDQPVTMELVEKDPTVICRGQSFDLDFRIMPATEGPWFIYYDETTDAGTIRRSHLVTRDDLLPAPDDNIYRLTVSPLVTTTYTPVRIRETHDGDNICEGIIEGLPLTLMVKQLPELPQNIDGPSEVCQGDVVQFVVPQITHAVSYDWDLPNGASIMHGGGTSEITVEFSQIAQSGYVSVRGVNDCGQGPMVRLYVNVKPLPVAIGAITGPEELCQGAVRLAYSVEAIEDATGYHWTVPNGFTFEGNGGTNILVDIDPNINDFEGEITVTPYNDCGSSLATSVLHIKVHPLPVANAGFDDQICDDKYILDADPLPVGWTGTWTVVSGHGSANIINPGLYNSEIENISRGDVKLKWTVVSEFGCESYDEVLIRNNLLAVNAVASDNLVCNGETVLTGTDVPAYPNTEGRWTIVEPINSNAVFENSVSSSTNVSNMAPDLNVFRWSIIQNGCESSADVEVINNKPDEALIFGPVEHDVCGDFIELEAKEPVIGEGKWTIEQGYGSISDVNNHKISVTNLSQGTNIFRWTVSKGSCSVSAMVTVRNNRLDIFAGSPQVICTDYTMLEGSALLENTLGSWEIIVGEGNFVDGNKPDTHVTDLGPGENILRWSVSKNGCVSSDEVSITNNSPTIAVVGSTQLKCDFSTTLTGNQPSIGEGRWSVVKGGGVFEDITDPTTGVEKLNYGENIFRWTISNKGCSSYEDLIVINQHVEVDAGKDFETCSRTALLNGSPVPEGMTGEWRVIAGVGGATIVEGDRNKPNALVGGLEHGVTGFRWIIDNNSCPSEDIVYVVNNLPKPYPADAGGYQMIDGNIATMQASPVEIGQGTWELISGGGIIAPEDIHKYNARVTNLRRGENVFRWTVRNGDCFSYDETTIVNGEMIEANAGRNQTLCKNSTSLEANSVDVAMGRWSVVSGAATFIDEYDPNTEVINLAYGDNVLRWTIHYTNSSSEDFVTITNNTPSEARAGNDDAVCADHVTLNGNPPVVGMGEVKWEKHTGGGIIENANSPSTVVHDLAPGVNRFIYTINKGGCTSTDTVTIINGTPTAADAGNDATICEDFMRLSPNTPSYGEASWQVGTFGTARFDGNYIYDLAPGVNELIYKIATDYCESTDVLTIVSNKPSLAEAGNSRDICTDEVTLAATPPEYGIGTWERISGSGTIEGINNPSTKVTGLAAGANKFLWTVDNNGCKSKSEVVIRNNFIKADPGDPQTLCSPSAILSAGSPLPGVGTWGVLGGSGAAVFEDMSDPNTRVSSLDPGENILTWTIDHKGCNDVATVSIINESPTTANAGSYTPTCDPEVVLAANIPVQGEGKWSIRNGSGEFSSDTDPSAHVTHLVFGENIFRWTIRNGDCVSYDDVVVEYNKIDAIAGDDRIVCDDEITLHGNNPLPGVGEWSVPGGQGSAVFVNSSAPNTQARNLQRGANTLRWTIRHKGCVTYDDVVITNNLPSTAYAGNKQSLCDNTTILDATEPEIGSGHWSVVTGSVTFEDDAKYNSRVTNLGKGENILLWRTTSDDGTCSLDDQVIIVNNKPSTPYAGASYEELCSSTFTLKAARPDYGTGIWSFVKGGGNISDPYDPGAVITNLDHGTNHLLWTVSAGECSLSAEVTIENNSPTIANAGPDMEDCKNWHLLDANYPVHGTGTWSRISGYGDFDDPNNPKTTVRNLEFGENVFKWTIEKGSCSRSDVVTIFNMIPDQAFAGSDQSGICEDYTILNANDPTTGVGKWEVVKGKGSFEDAYKYNTIVRDVGFGENIYRWSVSYGSCSTDDEVVVSSNKSNAYAGEDQVVYEPEALLNANNAGSLIAYWVKLGTSTAVFDDETFFNTSVNNLSEGINTFEWRIDVDGCISFDRVSIDYRSVPDAGFITDIDRGCFPLKVLFTNYSVGGSNYIWDFGDGEISTERNPEHTFYEPGIFKVQLTAPGPDGQDGNFVKEIMVYDHPIADFTANPQIVYIPGEKVRFYDLSTDAVSWLWDFGDGNTSNERNPSYEYREEGVYDVSLLVTNNDGCEDTYIQKRIITANQKGFIKFPNAFRPRIDGSSNGNDPSAEYVVVFKPAFKDVDKFKLEIFNRWGQKIFETDNIDEGWDGMHNGSLAPQAVYVYKVTGQFINGREFRETGSVLLVR